MAIKLRNHAESEDFQAGVPGTQAVSANAVVIWVLPFACVLKGILARVRVAGTTGTANLDLRKNGTTIFASGAAGIQFASGSTTPTYGAVAAQNPPVFAKGDILTVVVTAINTTPAQDTGIAINFQRFRGSGIVAQMLTDTLGIEAE